MRIPLNRKEYFHFKRWTRRKEAVLLSLHRVIRIAVLAVCMLIISRPLNLFSQAQDSIPSLMEYELEEVRILGESLPGVFSQHGRKLTVISATEIERQPSESLQDLLEYVAGVDIRQRNTHGVQADVQIRGGSFDQVMILLNGMNITDPQTGHFNLNLPVDLSSIERIEILYGSGARIHGANAFKGVINIITRDGWNGIRLKAEAGMFGLFHSSAGAGIQKENHYHYLDFSGMKSEGFTRNTDYLIRNLYYRGGVKQGNNRIEWQAGINSRHFGANDFYSPMFPDQYEETGTGFAGVRYLTGEKLKSNLSLYFRSHKDHFLLVRDNPVFYENFHRSEVYGFNYRGNIDSKAGKTIIGFDYRTESIISSLLGEEMAQPVAVKGSDSAFYTNSAIRRNAGIYAEQKWGKGNFFVSGGILINVNPEYEKNLQVFPGADLSYILGSSGLKIRGSASRSLRLPSFTDMYYIDPANRGNPYLQPEELISFELGTDYRDELLDVSLGFFNDRGKNLIDWVIFEGETFYKAANIAKTNGTGTEASVGIHDLTVSRSIKIRRIGLSYAGTKELMGKILPDSKYAGDYLRHKLVFLLQLNFFDRLFWDNTIAYQDRNGSYSDYDQISGQRVSREFTPYWLAGSRVAYRMKKLSCHLSVSNLLDVKYNDVGNLVQPGRWITAGITLNLDLNKGGAELFPVN